MLVKWVPLLAAVVLLSACSNRIEQAQELLKSRVSEKSAMEFQNLEAFPDGAVCGEFRLTDPMRGSRHFRRFISYGNAADDRPSNQDWEILCSKDAAAALLKTLGIGPLEDPQNQLTTISGNLREIQSALAQYEADNYSLPSSEQGLAALVAPTDTPPLPLKFKPGGYIAILPKDPWGQPYLYERSALGGVAQEYRLYTLGADSAPGGSGKNADIGLEHLKYLLHLGL